jgi:hypothetical protein
MDNDFKLIAETIRTQLARAQERVLKLSDENARLQKQIHAVQTLKIWRNEDGKSFIFVEDLAQALGLPWFEEKVK